jgi:hypothetical protein
MKNLLHPSSLIGTGTCDATLFIKGGVTPMGAACVQSCDRGQDVVKGSRHFLKQCSGPYSTVRPRGMTEILCMRNWSMVALYSKLL